jgi:hypothetical protein
MFLFSAIVVNAGSDSMPRLNLVRPALSRRGSSIRERRSRLWRYSPRGWARGFWTAFALAHIHESFMTCGAAEALLSQFFDGASFAESHKLLRAQHHASRG